MPLQNNHSDIDPSVLAAATRQLNSQQKRLAIKKAAQIVNLAVLPLIALMVMATRLLGIYGSMKTPGNAYSQIYTKAQDTTVGNLTNTPEYCTGLPFPSDWSSRDALKICDFGVQGTRFHQISCSQDWLKADFDELASDICFLQEQLLKKCGKYFLFGDVMNLISGIGDDLVGVKYGLDTTPIPPEQQSFPQASHHIDWLLSTIPVAITGVAMGISYLPTQMALNRIWPNHAEKLAILPILADTVFLSSALISNTVIDSLLKKEQELRGTLTFYRQVTENVKKQYREEYQRLQQHLQMPVNQQGCDVNMTYYNEHPLRFNKIASYRRLVPDQSAFIGKFGCR